MEGPLIARAWRRAALLAALLGLGVFLSLAVYLWHGKRTEFDSWAFRVLPERISASHNQLLLGFTEPSMSMLLLALVVVFALSARHWQLAVLAASGPAIATVLASAVAKPLIHRTLFGGTQGSFPSGHETGVACTATVLLVAFGQLRVHRVARAALVAVLAVWVLTSAVALTRFYYHYATDTIGAIGWSVAFVLGFAALLDRCWPRRRPRVEQTRAARPRPHRARPRPAPHRPRPDAGTNAGVQLTPRS